jgi:hypothetical protein
MVCSTIVIVLAATCYYWYGRYLSAEESASNLVSIVEDASNPSRDQYTRTALNTQLGDAVRNLQTLSTRSLMGDVRTFASSFHEFINENMGTEGNFQGEDFVGDDRIILSADEDALPPKRFTH